MNQSPEFLTSCPQLGRVLYACERGDADSEALRKAWQGRFPSVAWPGAGAATHLFDAGDATYHRFANGAVLLVACDGDTLYDGQPLARGARLWHGPAEGASAAWQRLFGDMLMPSATRGVELLPDGGKAYLLGGDRVYECGSGGAAIYDAPAAARNTLTDFVTLSMVPRVTEEFARVAAEYDADVWAARREFEGATDMARRYGLGIERAARVAALALFLAYRSR